MKVFHVVHGAPIGPSWIAYIEKPNFVGFNPIKTWVEEIEFLELSKQFEQYVIKTREYLEDPEVFPCVLTVHLKI